MMISVPLGRVSPSIRVFAQFPMRKNYGSANDDAINWRIVRDRVGNIPTKKTNRPRAAKVP